MRPLIVLLALAAVAAGQFHQPRFGSHFLRFDDDDFDDFLDDDHHDDSLEDLYEDLYDDDADDRAEARAALTRLRASGAITGDAFRRNRFVNAGSLNRHSSGRGFTTNRSFHVPRTSPFNAHHRTAGTPSAFNAHRSPSFNAPRTSFSSPSSSSFHAPLSSFNSLRSPLPASPLPQKRPSSSSSFSKFSHPSSSPSLNAIPPSSTFPSSFRKTSSSPFKTLPSGFTWPGGSGYYFSMSKNGAKPVTYFIRYDDD